MIRTLRQTAFFGLLAVGLVAFASPRLAWSQEPAKATQKEKSAPAHEMLFHTINFIILVVALGYVLRKPAADFFSSRTASIRKGLDEGRRALESSQSRLQAIEQKLLGLEAEIAAFKESAARDMEAERQRLQQASAEEAARIVESARTQISTTLRGARLELKHYAAEKSVALAAVLIQARLDESARHRLVTQFATTLDGKSQV